MIFISRFLTLLGLVSGVRRRVRLGVFLAAEALLMTHPNVYFLVYCVIIDPSSYFCVCVRLLCLLCPFRLLLDLPGRQLGRNMGSRKDLLDLLLRGGAEEGGEGKRLRLSASAPRISMDHFYFAGS